MEIYSKTSIKCEDKLTKNKTLKDKHFHKLPPNEIYLFRIHRTNLVIVFNKRICENEFFFTWIVRIRKIGDCFHRVYNRILQEK